MTIRIENKVAVQPGEAANEAVTKAQLDTAAADARNRANHTGTQTASTISDFAAQVNALIEQVVGAAPEALDTLQELAAALGDDPNYAATVSAALADLDGRLDVVEGGGARSLSQLVGDGVASTFTVTHGWALANKNLVRVEIVEVASGETVLASVARPDANSVTVTFGTHVPTANQYVVLLSEVLA